MKIEFLHSHSWSYSASGDTITATCVGEGECSVGTQTLKLGVSATSKTYDGSTITASISKSAGWTTANGFGADPTITYSPDNSANVGTYTASVKVGTATATKQFTINPATMSVTANGYSGTYDRTAHGITVTAPSGADVKYGTTNGSYTLNASPTYIDAGTYTVYYQVTKANYTTVTGSKTITISPKEVGLNWGTTTFPYDGSSHVPTATATGLISGDACTVTVTGGQTNVGSYTATASGLSNGNYELPSAKTTTFQITPKSVTITAKAQTITYGGSIATGTGQVTVSTGGLISGDSLTAINLTPSTDNATTSGTITPSAAEIKKGNTDITSNYNITYTAGDLTINKASISPVVSITGWTYGAAANVPSITSGNPGSGTVTYRYTGTTYGAVDYDSATVPTQAGNYTVTATVAETDNYLGNTAAADFTIERAPITPSITITGWTYGDTANAPVVTGNIGNGAESIRYTNLTGTAVYDSSIAPTDAGDYRVTYTVAQTNNYLGNAASADFTIARQDVDPVFDPDNTNSNNVIFNPATVPNGVTPTVTLLDAQRNTIPTTEYKVATNGVDHEVIIQDKLDGAGTTGYGNYNIATSTIVYPFEPGTATVTTVPRAATLTYNGANQSLLATGGAAANGSMAYAIGTDDTTEPSASDYVTDYDALTGKDAGDYYVWYKAVGDGENYHDSTPVCLRVTISKAVLTVTANEKDITYGDAPANAGVTYAGFQGNETATDLDGTLTYSYTYSKGGDVNAVGSATYNDFAIIPSGYTSNNYRINYVNGTLRVNKKPVDITITTADKVYDGTTSAAANATFTAADTVYTGDDLRIQNGTAAFSDANVGTGKTVTFSGFALAGDSVGNYLLNSCTATATADITAKDVTVTGIRASDKVYDGTAVAEMNYGSVSFTGLVDGEDLTIMVTGTFSDANAGEGKTVSITDAALVNGTNGRADNYHLTSFNTTTTADITARPITITAGSDTKTYDGTALTRNTYDAVYTGDATKTALAAGDVLEVTVSGSRTAAGSSDNTASGAVIRNNNVDVTANYQITYAKGTLTVNRKAVTITASDASKTYDGTALTESGFTATALEAGDNHTFTVVMTEESTITKVGTQPNVIATVDGVAVSTESATEVGNYFVTIENGALTITAKALTVTADAQSKPYGKADPALTYTTDGLVAGDSVTGALTRAEGENVGTYEIGQGTLTAGANYVISYTAALLTINKANADTTAPTANALTYDGTAQALVTAGTPTGGALVYSTDGVTYSETIPTAKNAGQHTVYYKVTGDSNHNDKEAQTVTVTILAKTLTVTADAKSKVYGGEDPAFTYTSAGLVEGDSITGALSRTAGENVGAYPITQGTLTAGDNYSITYNGANLTITKADASVTTAPTAKTLTYTGAAQALVNEGTANGGTMMYALAADGETAPAEAYSVSVPTAVNAGTYTVYYKAAGDSNHTDAEAAQAVVTIQRKELAVVADAQSKIYGTSDPELTFTYEGLAEGDAFSGQLSRESGENIGQYEIAQGTLSAGTNYSITYTAAFLTIGKADSVITAVPTAKTLMYTGAAQELVNAGNTANGTMYYALGEADAVADFDGTSESANKKWSTAIPAVKTSGTYHVWYMVVGDSNHNNTMPVHITVSVGKKEIGIDWSDQNLTYNQAAQKPSAATETGSLTEGDDVTVIVSGEQTNANTTETPSYTATAVLAGADAGNYQIKADQQTATFTISPKALTDGMLMLADPSYVHDGEIKTPVITVKDGGITLTAEQDYAVDTTSTLSSADYGTYEILVTGKGNYTGSAKQAWEITDDKAPDIEIKVETSTFKSFLNMVSFGLFFNRTETVTVTAAVAGSGVDKVYYITSGTSVSTVEELVTLAGDNWTEIENGGSFGKNPEAKYIVYAKAVDNAGNVNYASSEGIVLDAVKPVVEVAGSSAKQEYNKAVTWTASDDYLKNVVITFTAEGETAENEIYHKDTAVEQTLLAGESALSDLGSYTIKAVDKAGNETVETFTITGREAEISGSEKSAVFEAGKTYDLSQLFSVEEGVDISTYEIVANADESIAAGAGTIAGDQLTITKAGLFTIRATIAEGVTDTEAKEYVKETTAQAKLTVGRADGTAGITVADVVYGRGLTVVTSSSTNAGAAPKVIYTMIADAAGAEIAEADRTTSETKPVLVGTYKAVVSYAATGLYNAVSAETTFKITPAVLTVTADAKEKPYGSSDPVLTYTVTGLAYEDVAETVITGALDRAEGENTGVYKIGQGTLRSNSNYTISYTGADLTISKAAVEVKTIAVPVEVSSAGVQNKIINLKDYLVPDAALAQTEAADGTPGGAKIELAGELADYITAGEMSGTEFSFNVAESESGLTGQIILTITSPNYADYKLMINLVSARKVTQVVGESEDVEETALETQEVPALEEFTEAQPEATVEVKMEIKLESEETVEKELGTAALAKIKNAITKAFGGVAGTELSQEYLDITVTKSVNGGTPQEIADVNRVLEIAVGYDLTGKYNPIIIREHGGAVSQFTKLSSRPTAGSYRDGTFYVSGSGKSGVIYIYARYFSTYTVAYTTAASYQVTFDDATGDEKAGSQNNIEQVIVETGAKAAKPADPERDGYDFVGWYIEGTNTQWNFDTAVTGDITLVAHWDDEDDDEEEIVPEPAPVVPEVPRSPKTGDVLPDYVLWMMIVAAGLSVGGSVVWGRRKEQE